MKLRLAMPLLCVALAAAGRADEPLFSSATAIADAAHDPAWKGLFTSLAPAENRQSFFEERRYFPFRTKPVVLTGEIRIAPGRGLSLRYLTPEARVVVVDRQGVLMRDDRGSELPAPGDGRAQAAISAMVDILSFNLPELQRNFDIHGIRAGAVWMLAFVPRDRDLAENLTALVVSGDHATLAKIELFKSPSQHIDILVHGARDDVIFTGAELARYFR
jgi:hypothetical protein